MTRAAFLILILLLVQLPLSQGSGGGPFPALGEKHRMINAVEWGIEIDEQEMDVSEKGIPHIAYIRDSGDRKELVHAQLLDDEWSREILWTTVGDSQYIGDLHIIVIGEDPVVAFTYATDHMMVSYISQKIENEWRVRSIGKEIAVVGLGMAQGRMGLVVANDTAILLLKANNGSWDRETILERPEGLFCMGISAGFPAEGSLRVAYVNSTQYLHFVERIDGAWNDTALMRLNTARWGEIDLYVADEIPLIAFDLLGERRSWTAERIDGEWRYERSVWRSLVSSKPCLSPDGATYLLRYERDRGMNLTSWRDGVRESMTIWSINALNRKDMTSLQLSAISLKDIDLVFSGEGVPHISYVNETLSTTLEYTTWVDHLPDNNPPTLVLSADRVEGKCPLRVTVNATSSDGDGIVVNTYLTFYHESITSDHITHDLDLPGNYTAYAVVWDDELSSTVASITIHVLPITMEVRITGVLSGEAPFETVLTAGVTGEDGNVTKIEWTPLGEVNYSMIDPFTLRCRFNESGRYVVFASAKDSYGSEAISYVTVEVSAQKSEGEGLWTVLTTILALLMVPILFSAAAILSVDLVRGGAIGTDRPLGGRGPGRTPGPGPTRSNAARGSPVQSRVRKSPPPS